MISPFAMASAPTGWLSCDGSAVSRTTYSDLFAVIGTTWGSGNGSSTFNVPDLRGAFLRGTGSHGTSNMADGNDFAGPSVGSFENDQMQTHRHKMNIDLTGGTGTEWTLLRANDAPGSGSTGEQDQVMSTTMANGTDGNVRAGDETRPFNAGVNYCIKT
jgi:microcystin-dependent protein